MARPNQSKKENIGIESPLPSPGRPPNPKIKTRETAQIQLPVRESVAETALPTPIPTSVAHTSDSSGLREETARVSSMPDSPEAEMRKTEPPSAMPDVTSQNPSIALAPGKKNSMMMVWILFGVSLLILIIQIWTYLS